MPLLNDILFGFDIKGLVQKLRRKEEFEERIQVTYVSEERLNKINYPTCD
jgi:hypothetical protein